MSKSAEILQYIADQAPESGLAPTNETLARNQLQSQLDFITTELHKNFGLLFNPKLSGEIRVIFKDNLMNRIKWVESDLDLCWTGLPHNTEASSFIFQRLSIDLPEPV